MAQTAAGVRIHQSEQSPQQVAAASSDLHIAAHLPYLNLVDDTYALGATLQATSYVVGMLARSFAQAQQIQFRGTAKFWSQKEPQRRSPSLGTSPSGRTRDPSLSSVLALVSNKYRRCSCLDRMCLPTWARPSLVTSYRLCVEVKPQLSQRGVPQRLRCKLLQATVGACLMWGMESIPMTALARRRMGGVQRRMLAPIAQTARGPTEPLRDFHRRRERVVSSIVRRFFACSWGLSQRYKYFSFAGHVARLSGAHVVTSAFFWRDQAWWEDYRSSLTFRTGGQIGRRPAHGGPTCRAESPC